MPYNSVFVPCPAQFPLSHNPGQTIQLPWRTDLRNTGTKTVTGICWMLLWKDVALCEFVIVH